MRWQIYMAKLFNVLLKPYVKETLGIENIPKNKPYVMISNHFSHFDSFVIIAPVMSKYNKILHCFGDKKAWWDDSNFLRFFATTLEAIPVDKKNPSDEPLLMALNYLEKGEGVILYPEGSRNATFSIQKAKTGFIRLALKAKVPIVPVGIMGTLEILPRWKRYPDLTKFKKVTVKYGEPVDLSKYYDCYDDVEIVRTLADKIMGKISELSGIVYN